MKKKIKIGIVGLGNISKKHVQAINANKQFELVGVCDTKKINLKCNTYKNIDEMLRIQKNIELISILSPSGLHFNHIKKSLKDGKNVVVEKPLCMNLNEFEKIQIYEKKYKKRVFAVYQNRLNPLVSIIKNKLKNKSLDKVFLFSSSLLWNRNDIYYQNSKWRGKRKEDGGVVMNQGIHNIDLFYYFFGKVKSVFLEKIKVKKYLECEDTAVISFQFINGIIGSFVISTAVNKENYSNSIEIFGIKNNIKIYGKNLDTLDFKKKITFFKDEKKLHHRFYKEVYSSIMQKKKNLFSTEKILHSMEIIQAINKSIKTGKKVTI